VVALLVLFPLEAGQSVAEREIAFVRGIESLLPPGARGLMLVGMLAALASTLDTHLNWGAAYLTNDLYARVLCTGWLRRRPSGRELVWVARAAAPLLMLASLAAMASLDSIQQAWHATLLLGAGLGVPLLLRWLWHRANAWGELAALGASLLGAPLLVVSGAPEEQRLLTIAALGIVASIGVSLATPAEPRARLDAFYARIRPPGFWGRPAARRRLARQLGALAAAAVSLYGTLLGIGSWLIGAPPPFGLPAPVWSAACLAAAAALAPVWLRELRADLD
jgi:Na+/proline symporter